MISKLRIAFWVVLLASISVRAQLPSVAQDLYDQAVAQDSAIVQYALNAGAEIKATPDGNSFYVQWFPPGTIPASTALIVSLHGSQGFAFHEFKNWHSAAIAHNCGIIALQWYRGSAAISPYNYFPDDTLYGYIDSALTRIGYPSGKAFLHGFSRGAARTYAMNFHDIQSGNNYFCTTMANSGGADLGYPLYHDIDMGVYGAHVFAGKHWNFFCGGLDPNPLQSGCPAMTNTQTWLNGQGATVDIYIQDASLGHDGFQLPTATSLAYRDSILENYIACYNTAVSAQVATADFGLEVFPHPVIGKCTLRWGVELLDAEVRVLDLFGHQVQALEHISGAEIQLDLRSLVSGTYVVQIADRQSFRLQRGIVLRQ